jgi:hypothetical protein
MSKQGQKLPDELKEQIRAHLAITNNTRETARHFGVSDYSVRKIRDENLEEFTQLHADKKREFVDNAWLMVGSILTEMKGKMREASFRDLATGLGIVADKALLVGGDPTSRSDNTNKNTHELGELTAEQADELLKAYMRGANP